MKTDSFRKKTIPKLVKLAAESPFTVVKVGVEKPPLQMNIGDDDKPWSYPCFKSGCPLSFGDVAARKKHFLLDHS